jgi:uncharacterized DUF497 family protein
MSRFEWDKEKNLANQRKHGISFEEASTIFEGPVLSLEDEGHQSEVRERSYGLIGGVVVVCVSIRSGMGPHGSLARAKRPGMNGNTLMPISKKRVAEIAAIAEEDIDTSDIPEAGEEFFKKAKLTVPVASAFSVVSAHKVGDSTRFSVQAISVTYAQNGSSTKANALGMRPMQERAYERRGEQYLLIKSPPASGKSRALMFIALDKLHNQGLRQAIIVVPERAIGASFHDEPLSQFGFLGRLDRRPEMEPL